MLPTLRNDAGLVKELDGGRWHTVATVDRKRLTPEGRVEYARLMAAAPEMLEVLRHLLVGTSSRMDWERVRALVARIEGA